jgi:putative selenate reductase
MSDLMRIQPFATQLRRVLAEYEQKRSIFDIPAALFYTPARSFGIPRLFGKTLATPVGPSAGPHTQLSQNIVASWLVGGRFIELKTVQARDDLVIARPCIDMIDEGYNVEWSQELTLDHSAHEYVVAWALVHVLSRVLGWGDPGVIFDMSVGYDLAGIRHPRMTRFMDTLADASEPLAGVRATLRRSFPQWADIDIPPAIVNSVTLSTMHGCPPDEIERIARYCLEERGLHTVVKLNPTLLGKEAVRTILGDDLGFREIDVGDETFEHDLQYGRAVELVASLKRAAAARGLTFGVKLSNTLAVRNHAERLPGSEMYLSGRALYPVTMRLYDRLLHEFDGDLHVSFSAGADAVNVAEILACGALPVTGCTDLLKPGGVARMGQWIESVDAALHARGAHSLADLSRDPLASVRAAAEAALRHPRYKSGAFPHGLPKVASALGLWDCIVAPCVEACAVEQDVPEYAWHIAQGDDDSALETILARNPLPGVTGYVCTRLCQTRCTRNDYEESVAIRALKRFAEEHGRADFLSARRHPTGRRVAIVGSGPSGLAAAASLALSGVTVTVFEARDVAGGMLRVVPPFRLPSSIIERDIARIVALGVEIRLNARIDGPPEDLLGLGFEAVYLATGFQRDAPLRVPGSDGPGVMAALDLLDRSRRGERVDLGRRVVVVGGGDTAMDAVRTARRLAGRPVTLLYRRTRQEMPAAPEELDGALEEGNLLEELVSPVEILRADGRVTGVRCVRNSLGDPGPDGRRAPVPIVGSEFVVPADMVVVAVGQLPELAFLDGSGVSRHRGGGVVVDEATRCAGLPGVFAGGDVVVEPGSIISACADGRAAAESICRHLGLSFVERPWRRPMLGEQDIVALKMTRARRLAQRQPAMLPVARRGDFDLIEATLTEAEAHEEARRCVQCTTFCDKCVEVCPNRANYTFTIQPVRWRLPVLDLVNGRIDVVGHEDFSVRQSRQIVHVDDFCNECDDCQTFCVHRGRPYVDKPRLFLDGPAFAAETDNAFRIEGRTVRRRERGEEVRLDCGERMRVFEAGGVRVGIDDNWAIVEATGASASAFPLSLRSAAEMAVLYDGIMGSLPFLLME